MSNAGSDRTVDEQLRAFESELGGMSPSELRLRKASYGITAALGSALDATEIDPLVQEILEARKQQIRLIDTELARRN